MDDPTCPLFPVPELACLAAVLERAILDASGNIPGEDAGAKHSARRWLLLWTEDDHKIEFTFPWICQHLNLCPYLVRKKIRPIIKRRQKTKHIGTSFAKMVIASLDLDTSATGQEVYYWR